MVSTWHPCPFSWVVGCLHLPLEKGLFPASVATDSVRLEGRYHPPLQDKHVTQAWVISAFSLSGQWLQGCPNDPSHQWDYKGIALDGDFYTVISLWKPGILERSCRRVNAKEQGRWKKAGRDRGRKSSPRASVDQCVLEPKWPLCVGIICFVFSLFKSACIRAISLAAYWILIHILLW